MRAPPEAANRMKGVRFSTARSMPAITASPAAMPSEPAMKRKSCAAATTSWPSSVPSRHHHRVLQLRVAADGLEAVGVALAVAELERVVGDVAHRHDLVFAVVEQVPQALGRVHAHVVVGAGDDELVGLQVLVEDHLPGVGALHPQVVGHLTLGGEQPADLGTDIVDPVHASRAPSTPLPACSRSRPPLPPGRLVPIWRPA